MDNTEEAVVGWLRERAVELRMIGAHLFAYPFAIPSPLGETEDRFLLATLDYLSAACALSADYLDAKASVLAETEDRT